MKSVLFAALVAFLGAGSALAGSSMIGVGAGVAALGEGSPFDAVFKVEAKPGASGAAYESRVVVAHVDGTFTVGSDGVRYMDFHFETVGFEQGVSEEYLGAITFLNVDVQKNVVINNDLTYRITLLGLRGEFGGEVSSGVKMYAKGALDLLGLAYTKRVSDGASSVGAGTGMGAEIGVDFDGTFRVSVGEKLGWTLGKPETVYYPRCDFVCDEFGCFDSCYTDSRTQYNDSRVTSSTTISLAYSLGENLGLFGQAAYNVYMVSDDTGETRDSTDATWQYFIGMNGRF